MVPIQFRTEHSILTKSGGVLILDFSSFELT
jgi:hypothetical protein